MMFHPVIKSAYWEIAFNLLPSISSVVVFILRVKTLLRSVKFTSVFKGYEKFKIRVPVGLIEDIDTDKFLACGCFSKKISVSFSF